MDLITCTKCHEQHDPSWFSRDYRRRRKGYRTPWCKPCLRAAARERRTGLTQEEFDRLLAEQDGRCGICRTVFETGPNPGPAAVPRIDRAADGRVRGLLCPRCKVGLSTFQDDADRLRAAVGYLAGCRHPI
jgi:Recombination endonuclease VII